MRSPPKGIGASVLSMGVFMVMFMQQNNHQSNIFYINKVTAVLTSFYPFTIWFKTSCIRSYLLCFCILTNSILFSNTRRLVQKKKTFLCGSVGWAACWLDWRPEFYFPNPHGGRRQVSFTSYVLIHKHSQNSRHILTVWCFH